jgi:predicted phage baseplate assembly protein
MALISPILDNRSYQQLRDELVKRITVYAPEWTDHNESDPGIALLELFAYLGESMLFQFNQIPDATRLAFLRLLGVQPRIATTARVMLAVSTELADGVQILKGSEAKGGSVSFETSDEVYAWPLDSIAVGKLPANIGPLTRAETDRRDDALARMGLSPSAGATFYNTVEVPADPMAPDATPLDVSTTLDQSLWIALLGKPATNLSKLAGRTLFVGVGFDEAVPPGFDLQQIGPNGSVPYAAANLDAAPPAMLWQIWNGSGQTPPVTPLDVLGDTTGGMVSTGVVKLQLPKTLPVIDPIQPPAGDASSPPPLTDQKQARRVVGWLQVSRPDGENDAIHRVSWVGFNAVGAEQARTVAAAELLGTGTGDADQQYALTKQPVLPGTVRLQVEGVDGWQDWTEVDSFVRGGPDDLYFSVDYSSGIVQFGSGRAPQIGERIRVLSYRYGGGAAGNAAAGSITAIAGVGGVKVANPMPAAGGADPATLTDAMDQIPADVHRSDRAVIASDFRDLAMRAGPVARAEPLPLLHPDTPDVNAAGVISVVVFPTEDLRDPAAPLPDHALLREVARYLDERRLVTTELYVIPPTYKPIEVSVGVQVRDGYQVDAVRRWVELILRQYLSPLPPYGPDGGGWPLGRTVRRAELEAVAVQVEGVEYLVGLQLAEPDSAAPSELVSLQRWEVPKIVNLSVVAGPPLPPGVPIQSPAPTTTPVPLPPDVCS